MTQIRLFQKSSSSKQSSNNKEDRDKMWQKLWGVKTIADGKMYLMQSYSGKATEIGGPRRIFGWGHLILKLRQVIAAPNEYIQITFINGEKKNLKGPCSVFENPMKHHLVEVKPALELKNNEVMVVYQTGVDPTNESAMKQGDAVVSTRRKIIVGPALYSPEDASEYVHEFHWHGTASNWSNLTTAAEMEKTLHVKIPGALKLTKIRTLPDQTYIDCPNVRTRDDAVITLRFMIFYHIVDVQRMLDSTHDPIADFVNSLTSDAIEFAQKRSFEQFKQDSHLLNGPSCYRTLNARCEKIGYMLDNVVFRGYNSGDRLQQMHNAAIEQRTQLALEQETEEQKQKLLDFKLNKTRERVAQELSLEEEKIRANLQNDALRTKAEIERTNNLDKARLEREEAQLKLNQKIKESELHQYAEWRKMGVNLTSVFVAREQKNVGKIVQVYGGAGLGAGAGMVNLTLEDSVS